MAIGTATAIMGGASLLGAGLSAIEGDKGRKAADNAAKSRNAILEDLKRIMPDVSDLELELMLPQLVGEYTPEAMEALDLGQSSMEDVTADQQLKLEQLEALAGIGDIAEGGFTEADKAGMREFDRGNQQNLRANLDSILMGAQQRGVADSGAALAAQLDAAQKSTDMRAAASDRMIQDAQARSLQALMQQGSMAGGMRSQDFGERSSVAQARDAINRFNVQNQQNVSGQNVAQRNLAQQQNLQNKQAIANAQVALQNQQQKHNKNLLVDDYNRQSSIAEAQAGVVADRGLQEQKGHRDIAAGISGAAGGLGKNLVATFAKPQANSGLRQKVQQYNTLDAQQNEMANNLGIDPNDSWAYRNR